MAAFLADENGYLREGLYDGFADDCEAANVWDNDDVACGGPLAGECGGAVADEANGAGRTKLGAITRRENERGKAGTTRPHAFISQAQLDASLQRQQTNRFTPFSTGLKKLSNRQQGFIVEPSSITFDDFECGSTYSKTLTLTNISDSFNTFRIERLEPSVRTIMEVKYVPQSKMSAGMTATVEVMFAPQSNVDVSTVLTISTQIGLVTVPISCRKKRISVRLSVSAVDFGTVVVGESKVRKVKLFNDGALPARIVFGGDVCSLLTVTQTANDITQRVLAISPPVSATDGARQTIRPHGEVEFELMYSPLEVSALVTSASVHCVGSSGHGCTDLSAEAGDDITLHIPIRGAATDQPVFVSHNAEIDFRCCLLGATYCEKVVLTSTLKAAVKITPRIADAALEEVVTFYPPFTFIQGQSTSELFVKFTPRNDTGSRTNSRFCSFFEIDVFGLSLPLRVRVSALLTESTILFDRETLDIGECLLNERRVAPVTVTNPSLLTQCVGFPEVPAGLTVHPRPIVTLLPNEAFTFELCAQPPTVAQFSYPVTFLTEYGFQKTLRIVGVARAPALHIVSPSIQLAACPVGGSVFASTVLRNASDSAKLFLFDVDPLGEAVLSPMSGRIESHEEILIFLQFTARHDLHRDVCQEDGAMAGPHAAPPVETEDVLAMTTGATSGASHLEAATAAPHLQGKRVQLRKRAEPSSPTNAQCGSSTTVDPKRGTAKDNHDEVRGSGPVAHTNGRTSAGDQNTNTDPLDRQVSSVAAQYEKYLLYSTGNKYHDDWVKRRSITLYCRSEFEAEAVPLVVQCVVVRPVLVASTCQFFLEQPGSPTLTENGRTRDVAAIVADDLRDPETLVGKERTKTGLEKMVPSRNQKNKNVSGSRTQKHAPAQQPRKNIFRIILQDDELHFLDEVQEPTARKTGEEKLVPKRLKAPALKQKQVGGTGPAVTPDASTPLHQEERELQPSPLWSEERCTAFVDFGKVCVGQCVSRTVRFSNRGRFFLDLAVAPLDPFGPFHLIRPPLPVLAPDDICGCDISFSPVTSGLFSETMRVRSSPAGNEVVVKLRGQALHANLIVSAMRPAPSLQAYSHPVHAGPEDRAAMATMNTTSSMDALPTARDLRFGHVSLHEKMERVLYAVNSSEFGYEVEATFDPPSIYDAVNTDGMLPFSVTPSRFLVPAEGYVRLTIGFLPRVEEVFSGTLRIAIGPPSGAPEGGARNAVHVFAGGSAPSLTSSGDVHVTNVSGVGTASAVYIIPPEGDSIIPPQDGVSNRFARLLGGGTGASSAYLPPGVDITSAGFRLATSPSEYGRGRGIGEAPSSAFALQFMSTGTSWVSKEIVVGGTKSHPSVVEVSIALVDGESIAADAEVNGPVMIQQGWRVEPKAFSLPPGGQGKVRVTFFPPASPTSDRVSVSPMDRTQRDELTASITDGRYGSVGTADHGPLEDGSVSRGPAPVAQDVATKEAAARSRTEPSPPLSSSLSFAVVCRYSSYTATSTALQQTTSQSPTSTPRLSSTETIWYFLCKGIASPP